MHNVGIEAHIHEVEDGCVVDAHAEGRIIGEDVAVNLFLVSFHPFLPM
jgi:hypothetical protein